MKTLTQEIKQEHVFFILKQKMDILKDWKNVKTACILSSVRVLMQLVDPTSHMCWIMGIYYAC
jgi:hypothetical protein